jgi:hypothetical protein
MGRIGKIAVLILFASMIFVGSGCSTEKYAAAKVSYTTQPSKMSKFKKISRNTTSPMVKQSEPLAKKYIIKNTRRTAPPW